MKKINFVFIVCFSFRPQRSEGQEQFGGPRVYHQNHQYQYPEFGQSNRYEHPRPVREYRPGAPRNNAMNNSTTFVNSNKSHYQGSNGPSTGPRYNNYASKYEAVSLVSIIEILFYFEI